MDNGWQMRCSPPFPLSTSMLASSTAAATQIPLQEPRNQMKMNLGNCVLPHSVQEPTLMSPGVKSASTFSYMLNFGSSKPVTAESGHSFLSVVSVVPSMFQHDFQEQSTGKSPSGSYYPTKYSFCNTGTMPNWPLLQNSGSLIPGRPTPVSHVQPTFPFRPTPITNNHNIHGRHTDLDALRAVIRTENGSGLSCRPSRTADGEVCHGSIGNSALEASPRATSSVAMNQTSVRSECPRVFCMSACGDLLLSNTGLLGILCSCHGLHMSVSNFCEHSGLSDVNPGHAVHMDNGECIAQWRKLYLQKFGITALDDYSGWDWPEGLLMTSSLVRSKVAVPDGGKVFDLSSLFTSSVESIKSSHPRNSVFPCNPQFSQECVNKMSTTEQLGNGCQQYSLMGHTVSSRRNSYSMTDNPLITCGASSCLMMPRANIDGGSTDYCQSSSLHSGIIPSSENSFSLAYPNMQGIGSKMHNNNLKDETVLQRSALPSSIELKLGQPSQCGWGVGSPTLSTIKSNIRDLQTTTFQEQISDNLRNSRVVEHCDQHLHFHPISNSRRAKEQFQLDILNNERCTPNGASGLRHWKDALYNSSGVSVPVSSSNTSAGGGDVLQKETNRGTEEIHHSIPWRLHSQSHVDKSRVMELSCNGSDGPIWSLGGKELGLQKKDNSTMNPRCGHHSNVQSDPSFRLYAQQMENTGFFTKGGKPSHHKNCMVSDEKYNLLRMAGTLPDLYCASIHIENACSSGIIPDPGHVSSSLGFGAAKTLQASSSGSTTVVHGPGHDSALNNDVQSVNSRGPGESLRVLALRSAGQLLKEKLPDASMELNQRLRNYPQQIGWTKNCSISNVGRGGSFLGPGPSKGRHDHPFTCGDDATPNVVLDIAGNDNWDGLQVFMHGMAFNSEVTDKHVQGPCALQPKEQPSLSLGRGGNKVSACDMFQRYCEGPYTCSSGRCCCSVPPICSNEDLYSKDTGTVNSSNKQLNNAVVGAPKLAGFRLSDNSDTIEKAILVEYSQKMEPKHGKLDFLDAQWRDLPPKMSSVSKIKCPTMSEKSLVKNGEAVSHLSEIGAEGISTDQFAELRGIESSNISSGSSAPAVAQASIEVDKIDFSTVDAVDTGKGDDQMADQGSVINISLSDAIDSVKSSQYVRCRKARSTEEESPSELLNVAPHGVDDEFRQRHFGSEELRILGHSGASYGELSCTMQKNENKSMLRKRKHIIKSKMVETSVAVSHVSLLPSESRVHTRNTPDNHAYASEDVQVVLQSNQDSSNVFDSNTKDHSFKRRKSALSSVKMLSRKRHLNRIYHFFESESDDQRPLRDDSNSLAIPDDVAVKRLREVKPAESVLKPVNAIEGAKQVCLYNLDSEGILKCSVHCCLNPVLVNDENLCNQKAKPVACGKYGIICNRELDLDELKPPKILSLNQVLRSSRRISTFENENTVASVGKMVNFSDGHEIMCGSFTSRNGQVSKVPSQKGGFHESSARDTFRTYHEEDENSADDWSAVGRVGVSGSKRNTSSPSCCPLARSKPKEIRVRSLYELSTRGKDVLPAELSLCQTVMCEVSVECEPKREASKGIGERDGGKCCSVARRSLGKSNCTSVVSELDSLCCICGIPNKDSTDCLLECGGCFIRIHQACYGVSRVSKGDWYCRPCKTGAKNVACVLCGYGGGAMTRAFGSRGVVKTLLKAWNIKTESHIMGLRSAETLYVPAKLDSETTDFRPSSSIKPMVHNSVIAGLFDRTVRQWVHMVCGIWTPGTRCPNVDTMSAFDVSAVPRPKAHMICHICKRPGGSYTQCHVETCSSYFHPWCAHQKGLLQNEVECLDSHKVRFYGMCLLHAHHQPSAVDSDNAKDKNDSENAPKKDPTCARTQVYGGTKLQGGKHSPCQHNGKGKCLVTQVQLDAWLYINRQKFGLKRLPKRPVSDVEHDYRKEYARYKQAKGWKQLVVYKSGIHALGLYTCQFIPRGGMVVEYVGEIVGPRVADKRESEYLSGRKLQYKGACYFFRIDKEQIIDATRKGGIARFVNHACQPNCVAKVITIRSEKKVVFFAQRDINPGEEITYDYHFNHEDEGKKILCFCKSNNCRRYLN